MKPLPNGQDFSFFVIDPDRLDEEWVNHVRVYFEQASRLADLRAEADRAKANLEVVDAELDREIRLDPQRFGLDKVTEGAVEKTIILQKKHRLAVERSIQARHDQAIGEASVHGLDHKKRALEKLVELRLASYYGPKLRDPEGPQGRMTENATDRAFRKRKRG